MKMISFWLLLLTLTVGVACGQDAATQQQLDKLAGQIQDMVDGQAALNKRMDGLESEISDLRTKLNQPVVNDSASVEDLKKLRADVLEIDQKRQADNEQILKTLAKIGSGTAASRRAVPTTSDAPTASTASPQKGYEYVIAPGDTISAVATAYRAQGVKVTTEQIIAANPGLDATKLYVGRKIFVPDPKAK